MNKKRIVSSIVMLATISVFAWASGQKERVKVDNTVYQEAIDNGGIVASYDTGATWANWGEEFKSFEEKYPELTLQYNDLGSGATVARLEKEANNPGADTAYYSFIYGDIAKNKGVTESYKSSNYDKIPDLLKDPDGHWAAAHMGTVTFAVNTNIVKNVPQSWEDLLKPEYKNMIVYLDPRTTGVGLSVLVASAIANGGDEDNLQPGADFLGNLQKSGNVKSIDTTVPTAKFLKGEIPIWISYDFNHYKAKYNNDIACEIVIPNDGTVTVPYVISLVKNGPNPAGGKLWLDWVFSDEGQQVFAKGFVRPTVQGVEIPAEVKDKFLSEEDYSVAKNVDWLKINNNLDASKKAWEKAVL